jgi:hypothetical protein
VGEIGEAHKEATNAGLRTVVTILQMVTVSEVPALSVFIVRIEARARAEPGQLNEGVRNEWKGSW